MFQADPRGILALVAIAMCVALAVVLYRAASAAMTNTQNTPDYTAHSKVQVCESAIAEAMQGDGISEN